MGFDLAEYVRRSTLAQGLPERLEDPAVAAVVAEILQGAIGDDGVAGLETGRDRKAS